MFRSVIDSGWRDVFSYALEVDRTELLIVCPFIKYHGLDAFLSGHPKSVRVVTRYSLADFAEGVSDISALRRLLDFGASVRGLKGLHSKVYVFGSTRTIVASTNLTLAALDSNLEFGVASDDSAMLSACRAYFERLWEQGEDDLRSDQLDKWDKTVVEHRMTGGRHSRYPELPDFGKNGVAPEATFAPGPSYPPRTPQAFVKFLGEGHNRAALSTEVEEELEESHCHFAVAYPASKRPRSVEEGAVMFIGRLTENPNDVRVFGRAIGMKYKPRRDDATPEDIAKLPWKEKWPRYIRVHHAEFVAGTFRNAVSLNELMDELGADAFASTKQNAQRGVGNIDPRRAYRQQAAVKLSSEGFRWMNDRIKSAFDTYGKIPGETLDNLYWPKASEIPSS